MRPSHPYPNKLSEDQLIESALYFGDVWEIKKWIARGNDICGIIEDFHNFTPLEKLAKGWYVGDEEKDYGCTMNKTFDNGLHVIRHAFEERDHVSAFKILVFAGAEITKKVWENAKEEAFWKEKKKLLALLEELEAMENKGRGNFPPPLGEEEVGDEESAGFFLCLWFLIKSLRLLLFFLKKKLMKPFSLESPEVLEEVISVQPGERVLLGAPVPGKKNLWHVTYKRRPFFLDLSSFSLTRMKNSDNNIFGRNFLY